jgi:hypothetical protein
MVILAVGAPRTIRFNDVYTGIFSMTGAFQQTTSGLSFTNSECYELDSGCFAVYGYEYQTGYVHSDRVAAAAAHLTWPDCQSQRVHILDRQ